MTKNQNFKKGDRVRFTGNYIHYAEGALEIDKEYTVVSADEYGCDLSVQCTAYSVDVDDLELVEPYDRRTAFLTELQTLMRKHDAVIDIAADYGYSVGLSLRLNGEEVIHDREVTELHADNIMDFDKE